MKRIDILKASLAKKEAAFNTKLADHFSDVKSANGQPLNDKRNGAATMNRWERQNDSLRNLQASIEKTKAAIEREQYKIDNVNSVQLPDYLQEAVNNGTLIQWRKFPNRFFVPGVEKARIIFSNGFLAHKYVSSIPTKEQFAIFRDTFNSLNAKCREANQ